jgi:hypothetical protein
MVARSVIPTESGSRSFTASSMTESMQVIVVRMPDPCSDCP